jgi:hypothetical protein
MSKIAFIAAAGLVLVSAVSASAASTNQINDRQYRQADRIEDGRRAGSITWREGIKLRAEQRRIKKVERAFRDDGRLDRQERRILSNMQDRASSNIRSERRDSWRRAWWAPRVGR